ncbi:MAG: phosphotransferase [Spirochaetes bacterium]|nr:phosphotransferase [Spirochaetota bacterium]
MKNVFSAAVTAVYPQLVIAHTVPLVPEASTRRYYRLHLSDASTLVGVLEDAATAATNMPLVNAVQNFLAQNNIAVPKIYFTDTAAGIMLQQDLGDLSLNQALKDNPANAEQYYKEAIVHMLQWQRLADDGKCPAFRLSFDVSKFMFEFEFFITHTLLGYYKLQIDKGELSRLRAQFFEMAEALAAPEHKVFTHRDYHSRNILMQCGAAQPPQGAQSPNSKQYIIDFQDARLGLMQYDLCSLLCDTYAPMTEAMRVSLIDFAFEEGKDVHRQTRSEFDYYWRLSAFQRTVKAMGTFGRQATLGRADFAAYLNPAHEMLQELQVNANSLLRILSIISE